MQKWSQTQLLLTVATIPVAALVCWFVYKRTAKVSNKKVEKETQEDIHKTAAENEILSEEEESDNEVSPSSLLDAIEDQSFASSSPDLCYSHLSSSENQKTKQNAFCDTSAIEMKSNQVDDRSFLDKASSTAVDSSELTLNDCIEDQGNIAEQQRDRIPGPMGFSQNNEACYYKKHNDKVLETNNDVQKHHSEENVQSVEKSIESRKIDNAIKEENNINDFLEDESNANVIEEGKNDVDGIEGNGETIDIIKGYENKVEGIIEEPSTTKTDVVGDDTGTLIERGENIVNVVAEEGTSIMQDIEEDRKCFGVINEESEEFASVTEKCDSNADGHAKDSKGRMEVVEDKSYSDGVALEYENNVGNIVDDINEVESDIEDNEKSNVDEEKNGIKTSDNFSAEKENTCAIEDDTGPTDISVKEEYVDSEPLRKNTETTELKDGAVDLDSLVTVDVESAHSITHQDKTNFNELETISTGGVHEDIQKKIKDIEEVQQKPTEDFSHAAVENVPSELLASPISKNYLETESKVCSETEEPSLFKSLSLPENTSVIASNSMVNKESGESLSAEKSTPEEDIASVSSYLDSQNTFVKENIINDAASLLYEKQHTTTQNGSATSDLNSNNNSNFVQLSKKLDSKSKIDITASDGFSPSKQRRDSNLSNKILNKPEEESATEDSTLRKRPNILPPLNIPENDGSVQVYVEFPSDMVGLLIGRQGRNVKQLQQDCGVEIYVHAAQYRDDIQILQLCGFHTNVDICMNKIKRRFVDALLPPIDPANIIASSPNSSMMSSSSTPPSLMYSVPSISQMHLPEGVAVEVNVSTIAAVDCVFVQQYTHPSFHGLEALEHALTVCYSNSSTPYLPSPVQAGLICVAPHQGVWYRAQLIQCLKETDEMLIKFMDYGGYSTVPSNSIKQIRADFVNLPFQAVECYLDNIAPHQDLEDKICEEAVTKIAEMFKEGTFQARVTGYRQDGNPKIHLFKSHNEKAVLINQEITAKGLAEWVETTSSAS